jgi:PKD repeat protein
VQGRAAIGFLGTNQPGDYQALSFPGDWYAFIATTYDGGQTWTTVNATPNDPVQHATGVWQQGGSATDRNLLDFNEITIDDRGRVLYGYSDGCVTAGCIAGTAPNDFVAFMRVARQTGGKSLLQTYDGSTDTTAAIAPKAPCLIGPSPSPAPNPHSTRDSSASHLVWRVPDNGGANITQYQIFRGTTSGGEGTTPIGFSTVNKFDDTTALPSVTDYFYEVKAVNSVGLGPLSNEIDLQVNTTVVQNICALPGVTLFTDPAGDSADGAQTLFPATDLLAANVTQPYAPDGNIKLIFTINTTPEPNNVSSKTTGVAWFLAIKRANGTYTGVRMEGNPAGPNFFTYVPGANTSGGVDGRFVASETQLTDGLSSYNPTTGVISIVAPLSQLGLTPGTQITLVSGSTVTSDLLGLGAGITEIVDSMPNSGAFTAVPAYSQINANSVCAPDNPPIASMVAYPTGHPGTAPTGAPPLSITFDASGSSDPDAGDSVASYTLDFGDGSAPATQSTPLFTHTYTRSGDFGAQLKVTDTHGKISSNTALVDINVNTPPTAALAANPTSGFAPLSVSFDASGSSDPDSGDTIASYTFTFGDGKTATCPGNAACTGTGKINHTYTSPGMYMASLTVTDSRGASSTNSPTKTITVNGQPDLIVSALTASNNQAPQGSKVTLTATIKNQGNASAGASQTQFLLDGKTQIALVNTLGLAPGASVKVSTTWLTASVPKGSHTITATADKSNQVTESDETNNSKSITITIQGNKT